MGEQSLRQFVEEVSGKSHLRVEHDFGDGFVRLHTSEAERRQAAQDIQCSENIVLELLRNSRDAHARNIFLATSREGVERHIIVLDDGDGIPPSMHTHVFEPRVTSKLETSHMDAWGLHGRGMALYSIAENARSAEIAASDTGFGCSVKVTTDTNSLPEKRDQSGFPRFELTESGNVNVRGPRNIIRTACEFAIESRDACAVYVGSPSEIAATMYSYGMSTLSSIDRAFCKDVNGLPLIKRLATASDPDEFATIASTLGISLSERTARRIIDGQVAELSQLLELIRIESPASEARPARRASSRKKSKSSAIRIQPRDLKKLTDGFEESFAEIAAQYYLDDTVKPSARIAGGRLTLTIPLVEKL